MMASRMWRDRLAAVTAVAAVVAGVAGCTSTTSSLDPVSELREWAAGRGGVAEATVLDETYHPTVLVEAEADLDDARLGELVADLADHAAEHSDPDDPPRVRVLFDAFTVGFDPESSGDDSDSADVAAGLELLTWLRADGRATAGEFLGDVSEVVSATAIAGDVPDLAAALYEQTADSALSDDALDSLSVMADDGSFSVQSARGKAFPRDAVNDLAAVQARHPGGGGSYDNVDGDPRTVFLVPSDAVPIERALPAVQDVVSRDLVGSGADGVSVAWGPAVAPVDEFEAAFLGGTRGLVEALAHEPGVRWIEMYVDAGGVRGGRVTAVDSSTWAAVQALAREQWPTDAGVSPLRIDIARDDIELPNLESQLWAAGDPRLAFEEEIGRIDSVISASTDGAEYRLLVDERASTDDLGLLVSAIDEAGIDELYPVTIIGGLDGEPRDRAVIAEGVLDAVDPADPFTKRLRQAWDER